MNLRILIIEDDPENREGLRILISRHSPRSQVFLAGSVEEAYDLLGQNAIDIMFLDIRLPGQDGLSFLKQLRETEPDMCVVIISAYDSFGYAQQAIRLNVHEYLLKPYAPEEIYRILDNAQKDDPGTNETHLQGVLARWLTGAYELGDSLAEQLGIPQIKECDGWLFVLRPQFENEYQMPYYKQVQEERLLVALRSLWRERPQEHLVTCEIDKEIIGLVFCESGYESDCLLEKSMQTLSDTVGVKLSGAKSIKTSKLFIRAQGVYQRVHLLADNLFYTEPYTLLDAALPTAVHTLSLSSIHLSALQRMVNQGNANEAAAYTESVFSKLLLPPYLPYQRLLFELHTLLQKLIDGTNACLREQTSRRYEQRLQMMMNDPVHITQLKNEIRTFITELAREIHLYRTEPDYIGTEQYLEYVAENCTNSAFSKDIAAAHFGFHPDYFGALFKKATGKTFVTVLNELRMEKARVLLTTTHLKVYEIAEQVGIEDVKYFLRLFKKVYGSSPKEYRYIHRRE